MIKLVFLNSFDSQFKDNTYHIAQFVDLQTLNILNYSSTNLDIIKHLVIGNSYECTLTIKNKNKLSIDSIKL